jgi:acetoacetate decarboxylase
MTYPPSPWLLKGYATQTLHLVDLDRARQFVPPQLEIVAVLPGKTIGSTYISEYRSGSILEYNELIVAPALVKDRGKIGGWISHIYVDNLDSVAGGREIWGLPKEMAEFVRGDGYTIVKQQDKTLCSSTVNNNLLSGLKIDRELTGYCFGNLNGNLLYFGNDFKAKISSIDSKLVVPPSSPFANLNLGQPFLTLDLQNLNLVAGTPIDTGSRLTYLATVKS